MTVMSVAPAEVCTSAVSGGASRGGSPRWVVSGGVSRVGSPRWRRGLGSLVALGWLSVSAGWLSCDPGGDLAQPGTLPLPGCPVVQCPGGVSFAAELAATIADAPNLELELCHNKLCSILHPTASGASFECDFFGPLPVACRLEPSGAGLHLQGTFQGLMTNWRVGDTFSVRVGLPGAAPLVSLQKSITSYEETRPAGADCPPLCRSATLP